MQDATSVRGTVSRRTWLAIVAITLFALVARLVPIERMLPHLPEPDAFIVLHMQSMRGDQAVPLHQDYKERYPTLIARTLAPLGTARVAADTPSGELQRAHLAAASRPYLEVRLASAFLGALAVLLTFLVARRFLPDTAALLAAFWIATSLLHVLFSVQARPHVPQATLALLSVWLSLRAVERPSFVRGALASVATGLAVACLQSGFFAVPALAVAIVSIPSSFFARLARVALAVTVALAIAAPFYPVLPHIDATGVHIGGVGGHNLNYAEFNGLGFVVAGRWLLGHDPTLLVWMLVGVLAYVAWPFANARGLARGRRPAHAIVFAYTLPYLALIAINGEIYDRFAIPVLPYLAMLAAGACAWMWTSRSFVLRGIVLASLVLPTFAVLHFARISLAKDTHEQVAAWIEATPDARTATFVTTTGTSLPLLCRHDVLTANMEDRTAQSTPWLRYQAAAAPVPDGVGYVIRVFPAALTVASEAKAPEAIDRWLADTRPDYVVIELSPKLRSLAGARYLREAAAKGGELVFRSSGEAPDVATLGLLHYQGIENMLLRSLATQNFGAPFEVYRLRR